MFFQMEEKIEPATSPGELEPDQRYAGQGDIRDDKFEVVAGKREELTLMSHWKKVKPKPERKQGALAGQRLDRIAFTREQHAALPRGNSMLNREARRRSWLSFQPWGRA